MNTDTSVNVRAAHATATRAERHRVNARTAIAASELASGTASWNLADRWRLLRTRARYYVPVLRWLPRYDYRYDLVHDGLAGVTVAMLLIPQSLSYASGNSGCVV